MKILLLDIETAPILASVWRIWDQNISLGQIKSDWHLLSFAAKWLGERKVIYKDQSRAKNVEDDRALLISIHILLNEAEIVISHHGKKFDLPAINSRLITKGFAAPSPYRIVDTREIAAKHFRFTSNKLEFLSGVLCSKKKMMHRKFPGYELWKECLAGNLKAWAEMRKYNIRDVETLEELYLKLRPWTLNGPNFGLYDDAEDSVCPKCGGNDISKNGFIFLTVGKYQRFKCGSCGAWARASKPCNTKEKRASLLR